MRIRSIVRLLYDGVFIFNSKRPLENVYYFESSQNAEKLLPFLQRLFRIDIKKLSFKHTQIVVNGTLLGFWIIFHELNQMRIKLSNDPLYRALLSDFPYNSNFQAFLQKSVFTTGSNGSSNFEPTTFEQLLIMLHAAKWHGNSSPSKTIVFYLIDRCWMDLLVWYARRFGIILIPISGRSESQRIIKKVRSLKSAFDHIITFMMNKINNHDYLMKNNNFSISSITEQPNRTPYLAVQATNKINIKNRMYYSDVFFCQEVESLWRNNLVLLDSFRTATEQDWMESREVGNRIIALGGNRLDIYKKIEKYTPYRSFIKTSPKFIKSKSVGLSLEKKFIKSEFTKCHNQKEFSKHLINDLGVKVFVTEVVWNNHHIPLTDALGELGGISVFWQRSYQGFSSPESLISADIMLSWSNQMASIKSSDGSKIRYNIAVGYLGDHRQNIVKPIADKIRKKLIKSGAKNIFVFFDEAVGKDCRWWIDKDVFRRNYEFLLEKLLTNDWMGLVIKPKKPEFLKEDLGDIWPLLNEAESTNRLHLINERHFPPCGAALSGDIALGTDLYSLTAVVESIISGVPTLVLNSEPFNMSDIYRYGKDKVVFNSWDDLWESSIKTIADGDISQLLNHWSFFINDIDPFRDGKSAYRMGTYLQWLIQGFENGQDRETIMTESAEKYANRWGKDKVVAFS